MSELSTLSGKVRRKSEILKKLGDAALILEIDILEKTDVLNINKKQISDSKKFILEFSKNLLLALKNKNPAFEIEPIIKHVQSDIKPIEDWFEDLEFLINSIETDKLSDESITILENILSLIDDDFTKDVQQLFQ